jgi:hypothetical protein
VNVSGSPKKSPGDPPINPGRVCGDKIPRRQVTHTRLDFYPKVFALQLFLIQQISSKLTEINNSTTMQLTVSTLHLLI